jgi:hypothetical protein
MKEINRASVADKLEATGALASGLGIFGAVMFGTLFVGTNMNLSEAEIKKLTEEVNIYFQLTTASTLLAGGGAAVGKIGTKLRK